MWASKFVLIHGVVGDSKAVQHIGNKFDTSNVETGHNQRILSAQRNVYHSTGAGCFAQRRHFWRPQDIQTRTFPWWSRSIEADSRISAVFSWEVTTFWRCNVACLDVNVLESIWLKRSCSWSLAICWISTNSQFMTRCLRWLENSEWQHNICHTSVELRNVIARDGVLRCRIELVVLNKADSVMELESFSNQLDNTHSDQHNNQYGENTL